MARLDAGRLERVLRVRAIQRDLAQAEEAAAQDHAQRQAQLVDRIGRLAAESSPAAGTSSGLDLAASAGFRTRLHSSHDSASQRLATACAVLADRQAQSRAARQDHGVIEKLMERANARAALVEMRKLADLPHVQRRGGGTDFAES
jgi:flagellar protein FliJ